LLIVTDFYYYSPAVIRPLIFFSLD